MSERDVLIAAVVVALAAAAAWAVSWWAVAVLALVALVVRRPVAVIVVLVALSGTLAARSEAGLSVVPGRTVSGVASILSDPVERPGGLVVEFRLDGVRYRSFVPTDLVGDLRGALVGQEVEISGRTAVLDGPWEWRASRHLAGRLRLTSVGRIGDGAWWWRTANWMHHTVEAGLTSFDPEERALFLGVVFGDDRGQSELDRFRFRSSGLSHIMAVSGQNVAFMLVAVGPLLMRLRLGLRWTVTLVVLVWFALVTRLEPSVLRAVAMAMVAATAAWWGRYASGLRIVATAVIALLLIDPLLVWSTGFRLSVAASVSLVVLARPIARRIPGPRLITDLLGASLAAQVGTAPLLVVLSGSVPALGPVFNLLAVPVAGWLMVWGVVTGPVAGLVGEPLAMLLGWPSRWMLRWLAVVADLGSGPSLPRLTWVGVVASCAGLVAVAVRGWFPEARATALRAVMVVALVVGGVDLVALGRPPAVIGGSAFTMWTGGGATVLQIGSGVDERDVLDALLDARAGRLDVVIVTGGGRTSSGIVWSLRQVVEVGAVVAVDPSSIRDATRLEAGTIEVGAVALAVTIAEGGRASVGPV